MRFRLHRSVVSFGLAAAFAAALAVLVVACSAERPAGDIEPVAADKAAAIAPKAKVESKANAEPAPAHADAGVAIDQPRFTEGCAASPTDKGGPMCYVAAGEFVMGSTRWGGGDLHGEGPRHLVELDAFYADRHEVTVAEYRACVDEGGCDAPATGGSCNWGREGFDAHPVNCVSAPQAERYCAWAGERLPTEAEWEKAARGADGGKYPWGRAEFGGQRQLANILGYHSCKCGVRVREQPPCCVEGPTRFEEWKTTAPVESFPNGKSPYGLYDTIGNVAEWTSDWYDRNAYSKLGKGPVRNPQGPPEDEGGGRVVRGGSWKSRIPFVTVMQRLNAPPDVQSPSIGVRCVLSETKP